MKQYLSTLLIFSILSSCMASNEALTHYNTEHLRNYVDQGHYGLAIDDQAKSALVQVKTWFNANPNINYDQTAAIFDIDETLLSSYDFIEQSDFDYSLDQLDAWMELEQATPISPIIDVYQKLRAKGVKIHIITGRHEPLRQATENNLRQAGIDDWESLHMRPHNNGSDAIKNYKQAIYEEISKSGTNIILAIGDQYPDIMNEKAKVRVKLPNPFYNIMKGDIDLD